MSSEIKVDTISENTSANGVAIDSLGIKDGKITNLMNATLSAADLGSGIHIKISDTGASANAAGDELVIEDATAGGNVGISILSATDGEGRIVFGDSGDNDIGQVRYDHADNSMKLITSNSNGIVIDGSGHVTKPLQPAFCVNPSSSQSNVSDQDDIVFGTERFDIGSNFASNTFTAPVTGKYQLNYSVTFGDVDNDAHHMRITLKTSNKDYENLFDPRAHDTDASFFNMSMSVIADMDANDTAFLRFDFGSISSPSQKDIRTSSSFSGFLAC